MERWTLRCESCERQWTLAAMFSFYEQQTLESHPCPHCGAYTLACSETPSDLQRTSRVRTARWPVTAA